MADCVKEIGDSPLFSREQRGDEWFRTRDLLVEHGLPQGDCPIPAWRDDVIVANVEMGCKGSECSGVRLVESREDRGVIGDKCERFIVQRGKAMGHEGRPIL
jgi:hypothetical protein